MQLKGSMKQDGALCLLLWPSNLVKILLMMQTEALDWGLLGCRQLGLSGSFMGS